MDNEVRVIDSIAFSEPKTKEFVGFLEAIKVDRSALVALSADPAKAESARKSGRNVEVVTMCRADQLNAFDMLNHRYLIISQADLETWLAGPWSQTGKDAKLEPKGAEPKSTESKGAESKAEASKGASPKAAKTKVAQTKGAAKA